LEASFWLEKWQESKHGWMQEKVNSRLLRFWSVLELPVAAPVIVPLCGDSIDIDWLVAAGHSVCGCELSERALAGWFERHGIAYDIEPASLNAKAAGDVSASIKRLTARARQQAGYVQLVNQSRGSDAIDDGIEQLPPQFLCGDVFSLQPEHLPKPPAALFDRAALIALPPPMRQRYAAKIAELLPSGAKVLLITLNYDQGEMKGPPFSVQDEEVMDLYQMNFSIEKLSSSEGPEIIGNLAERGLTAAGESVFLMTRS